MVSGRAMSGTVAAWTAMLAREGNDSQRHNRGGPPGCEGFAGSTRLGTAASAGCQETAEFRSITGICGDIGESRGREPGDGRSTTLCVSIRGK